MRKIPRLLGEWRDADLITAEQVEGILAFEAARPSGNWMLHALLGLAAFVIGVGVIALVAANFEDIPDTVKLGADFALLIGLGYAVLAMERRGRELGFEILLVAFLLGCLATIGLISQVFHTGGHLDAALLFWCAITGPAALMARRRLVSSLWSWTLVSALVAWIFRIVDEAPGWYEDDVILPMALAFPFACHLAAMTAGRVGAKEIFDWSYRAAGLAGGFVAIVLFDIALNAGGMDLSRDAYVLSCAAVVPAVASLLLVGRDERLPLFRKRLFAMGMGLFLLMGLLAGAEIDIPFVGLVFSIALMGLGVVDLGVMGRRRWSQALLAVIGVRFIIFYFIALGGLALTGVGLIGSGLLILLMAWAWRRNQTRLQGWLEGMAQ